jgi:hypothetical protein
MVWISPVGFFYLDLIDQLFAHCISAKIKSVHQNTRQELSRTRNNYQSFNSTSRKEQ